MPTDVIEPVLRHFRYHIQEFPKDDVVKAIASPQLLQDLTELTNKIDAAIKDWNDVGGAAAAKGPSKNDALEDWHVEHDKILKVATEQFKKGFEKLETVVTKELPFVKLKSLKEIVDWISKNDPGIRYS